MDKVVEPSEIIVDQPSINEDVVHINPWNRFLARFFDYAILSLLLNYIAPFINNYNLLYVIPVKYLIWVPIETLLMSLLGYTPGKFLLQIKVVYHRNKLSLYKAFRRSILVWIKGIGLGIPIIMPIAMVLSYQLLYQQMKTKWDLIEKISISQKPVSLNIIVIVAMILIIYKFSSF